MAAVRPGQAKGGLRRSRQVHDFAECHCHACHPRALGGVARQEHGAEDAIPGTQIEKSAHRLTAILDDLECHRELFPGKGNRPAH